MSARECARPPNLSDQGDCIMLQTVDFKATQTGLCIYAVVSLRRQLTIRKAPPRDLPTAPACSLSRSHDKYLLVLSVASRGSGQQYKVHLLAHALPIVHFDFRSLLCSSQGWARWFLRRLQHKLFPLIDVTSRPARILSISLRLHCCLAACCR